MMILTVLSSHGILNQKAAKTVTKVPKLVATSPILSLAAAEYRVFQTFPIMIVEIPNNQHQDCRDSSTKG